MIGWSLGLPISRIDWIVAWRHLRMGEHVPAWVRWVNYLSVYLIVAGGTVAWYAANLGPAGSVAGADATPLQQFYGSFGGATVGVGLMGLTLGLLARFFNLLPTIITMSVLLGCMALVVVLSLMSGLEEDLREKILNQKAHIKISREDGRPFERYRDLVAALEEGSGIAGASAYLEGEIMVRSGLNRQGAILAGIVPEAQTHVSNLRELVQEGDYAYLDDPRAIPEPNPFVTIDEGTPWRLRHLESERHKSDDVVQRDPPSEREQANASLEASLAAEAAARAAKAAEHAVLGHDDEAEAGDEDDDGGALLNELPPPPEPAPRELAYDEDEGWEDPDVELEDLVERGVLAPRTDADDVEQGAQEEEADASDPVEEPPLDPILIGRELAMELGVRLGSEVQLITPIGRMTPAGQIPGVIGSRVAGIFFSGMYEYDRKNVYAPLAVVQQFLLTGDAVSGIEVKLVDADAIDAGKAEVERIVAQLGRSEELLVEDWRDLNRNLFSAMFLEKVAMFIALLFVVLVASFGILASNLMSVMEKSKEIAILKAMGMTDGGIMSVFIAEGLCVGLLGSLGGIAMGLALCWTLDTYGLPLNENVYYIEKLPVLVHPAEVVVVGIAAMFIVWISSAYPALVASRLRPVDALRQGDA